MLRSLKGAHNIHQFSFTHFWPTIRIKGVTIINSNTFLYYFKLNNKWSSSIINTKNKF
nr:MAG TPA: hypothetical protein [Caudoviricetes sp.]